MYKIYTRYGDNGYTKLLSGAKVLKCNEQIKLCNLIDNLNSWIGCIVVQQSISINWKKFFRMLIHIFFLISAEISYLSKQKERNYKKDIFALLNKKILFIEATIDYIEKYIRVLRNFIYPMNCMTISILNITRTIIRDIEANLVYLLYKQYAVNTCIVSFCNRLSDFFFVFSRYYSLKNKKKDTLLRN